MTPAEYQHAYDAGRYARQASRSLGTCPLYGFHNGAKALRDAWRRGWNDHDRAMRQGRAA